MTMNNEWCMRITRPIAAVLLALVAYGGAVSDATAAPRDEPFLDATDGRNWPAFGRLYGEQHYSPLTEINATSVGELKLAWSLDLDNGLSVTGPVEVDRIIYFYSRLSITHAVHASGGIDSGLYDPKVAETAAQKLRQGWGSRGIAYWNGKVFVGTLDGRLIAVNAHTGKLVWSALTVDKDDVRYITGPSRV